MVHTAHKLPKRDCHPERRPQSGRSRRICCSAISRWTIKSSLLFALSVIPARSHAQVIDGFAWVDLKTDTQTVSKVAQFLRDKPYTAIREIGVVGQQALVITTLRKDPIGNPGNDRFTAYGVSLKDGSVEELLDGAALKYIDWQKFYDYDTPELLATYDDCAQCKETTFLTAFYLDRKRHWGARWRREVAGAPLYSAESGVDHVYALFINVDQRVILDTWASYPEHKKSSRGGEFLFEYRIDPMSDQGTSRPLTGRDMLPVKQRLCKGEDVVFGIAGGQGSAACKDLMGKRK